MPLTNNLFKFMALRPVQKVSEENLRQRFIPYAPDGDQPQIYKQLMAQDSLAKRKQLAAEFILSSNYVNSYSYNADWVAPLRQILNLLNNFIKKGNEPDTALQEAQMWSDEHSEKLAEIKNQLWSSLYATVLSPRTLPHDRRELINLIRALFFVENRDTLDNRKKVAELLIAKPLIPEELFIAQPTPTTPDDGPAAPTWQKQKLKLFEYLRDQAHALQDAILEIETVERRSLHRLDSKPKNAPPKRSSTGDDKKAVNVGSPGNDLWRLTPHAVKALSDKTKRIVNDHQLSLEEDSTIDLLNGLEKAQRQYYASIYQIGGLQAVKTAGLMRTSASMESIPRELLDELTHSYNMPWLYPQVEKRFDETIEGSVGSVRPVGIGDLLVVKETLWKYEMGEVAHIENVLQSESKERVHRSLNRTEQTIFSETETTTQSEHDLQTTERFELQTEVQSTLQKDTEIGLGLEVSGGYGPVKVTASAEYATSTSQTDSASSASTFAQEVVDRSVESLTERIKESLTTTIVNEIEEINTHGFDNTDGTGHICGVYRWVDKYYLGQIYNYGKRLMFEFIVPEPASFYLHARKVGVEAAGSLTAPEPLADDFSFTDIDPGNYETWVDAYQVANVSPPPPLYKIIAKALEQPERDPPTRVDSLVVPEGYLAKEGHIHYNFLKVNPTDFRVTIGQSNYLLHNLETFNTLHDEDDVVPIGLITNNVLSYEMTIEVKCQRSDETLQSWQLATYTSILEAYNQQKSAYEAQQAAHEISQGVLISGNNPDQNRKIEREELKRSCLTLLTDQHFADFDATLLNVAPHGYPEFDVGEAMEEARYVQFFEQALDWDNISYLFYPYFWGRKEAWAVNSQLSDTDPPFADFLKAGSARVLVPVRRNYEEPTIYYLRTGDIWNGGEMPTINNELYVSIVDEMMAAADADLANATPEGEPWEIKLPTELVKLQEDSTLPDWTEELSAEDEEDTETESEASVQ